MKNKIIEFFKSKTLNYQSDKLYTFAKDSVLECSESAPVVIFSRQHYIERCVTFPITSKKDVKAAIQFEIEPLKTQFYVFYQILPALNGKTSVMIWQIPKSVMPEKCVIAIPETFLIALNMHQRTFLKYHILDNGKLCFVIKNGEGHFKSALADINESSYIAATGIPIEKKSQLAEIELIHNLVSSLVKFLPKLIFHFFVRRERKKIDLINSFNKLLIPVVASFTLYLILSSIYIDWKTTKLSEEITNLQSDINVVLDKQALFKKLNKDIESYGTIGQERQPVWKIWQIFAPLYKKGVKFNMIRFNGSQIFFRASAKSASDVLEYIHSNPWCTNAEFSTAVRKNGDLDSFIIRFTLNQVEKQNANK